MEIGPHVSMDWSRGQKPNFLNRLGGCMYSYNSVEMA